MPASRCRSSGTHRSAIPVYDIIDRKGDELRQRGIGEEDISRIINAELEYDMKQFTSRMPQSKVNRESLYKVMDRRIVDGVDALLKQTSRQFNRVYPESTFYGLCLHLSSTLERRKAAKQRLSNERILDVVQNHREEYAICMQFASAMEKELGVPMSIDEAVLLTLFLCEGNETHKAEDGPVVLIAMHGDSTASSVADVVNSLAGCGNTYAYDMPLDKDMQQACDELKAMIQELDRGQGILLLYDMGSLRTMAEVISKETGVQIRTVAVPGTDCSGLLPQGGLGQFAGRTARRCHGQLPGFLHQHCRAGRTFPPQKYAGHHHAVHDR